MKAHEKEEMEKREKLLATLEKHPLTAQIKAEEAAAILAKRTEAAAKIEALEKEREAVLPRLQKTIEAKEAAFLQAKAALQDAANDFNGAKVELSSSNNIFNSAIDREKGILFETAPEEIDQAILFFQEKLSWLRSPGRVSTNRITAATNVFKMTKETTVESNRNAVLGCLAYCQAAIPALQEMKLTPELDAERIEAIKKAIPSIDVFMEISGTRPLPKSVDASMLIPSEETQNYTLGKLHEKVDKLLHPRRA